MSPLAQKLYNICKELIEKVKALKTFTWHNLQVIADLVATLVEAVEVGQEFAGLTGAQKKAVVLEVLSTVIDAIDLKILPWWLPQAWVKSIAKNLLPTLIDFIVSLFNKVGHFKHKQ